MGQGVALNSLRPIAEIQYIDYLVYGLQPLTDDAASLHWRSKGRQSSDCSYRVITDIWLWFILHDVEYLGVFILQYQK
jgi:pyruvate/2-oxoglutarate/acetoin dehydrogenase E1 component